MHKVYPLYLKYVLALPREIWSNKLSHISRDPSYFDGEFDE